MMPRIVCAVWVLTLEDNTVLMDMRMLCMCDSIAYIVIDDDGDSNDSNDGVWTVAAVVSAPPLTSLRLEF